MKQLFFLLLALVLLAILVFEYRAWRRHRSSDAYAYAIDSTINWQEPSPLLVKEYLLGVEELAQYGRFAWAKHGVDVLTDSPTDPESGPFVTTYQLMLSSVRALEIQLKHPRDSFAALPADVARLLDNPILAKPLDQSALVFEIQKKLTEKGYQMPIDGIYKDETRASVLAFQQANQLYPSGLVDQITLERLFQNN